MTTIATDGHSMAADGLVSAGSERVGSAVKVRRTKDGRLFGACGPSADCALFEQWMHGEIDRPQLTADFSALILTPEGKVFFLCEKLVPVEFALPQAIGSGGSYALGALLAGASPEDAVRIACKLDTKSGGEVTALCITAAIELKEVA